LAVLLLLFFEVTTPDSVFHQLGILSPAHRWINLNHAFKDSGVWSLGFSLSSILIFVYSFLIILHYHQVMSLHNIEILRGCINY
jgi:hypothetical protein